MTESWAHPARRGRLRVPVARPRCAARALGRRVGAARYLEVRYEALVADSRAGAAADLRVRRSPYEPAMLDYAGTVDVSAKPHQQSLDEAADAGAARLAHGDARRRRRRVRARRRRPARRARLRARGRRAPASSRRAAPRLASYRAKTAPGGHRLGAAALAALAAPPPAALLVSCCVSGGSSGRERHQQAVQREVVAPVGRDPGRVLAEADLPDDLAVRDAGGVGLRLERREEDEIADDERRAEDPPADVALPELARSPRRTRGARRRSRRRRPPSAIAGVE